MLPAVRLPMDGDRMRPFTFGAGPRWRKSRLRRSRSTSGAQRHREPSWHGERLAVRASSTPMTRSAIAVIRSAARSIRREARADGGVHPAASCPRCSRSISQ